MSITKEAIKAGVSTGVGVYAELGAMMLAEQMISSITKGVVLVGGKKVASLVFMGVAGVAVGLAAYNGVYDAIEGIYKMKEHSAKTEKTEA